MWVQKRKMILKTPFNVIKVMTINAQVTGYLKIQVATKRNHIQQQG